MQPANPYGSSSAPTEVPGKAPAGPMQPPYSYSQGQNPSTQPQHRQPTASEDPVAEAESALQKLRKDPTDKQAADALEGALKRLKERAKPEGQTQTPQKE